jgi:hypothetical protein
MPQTPHPLDGVADELKDWITGEAKYYAEALKGGHRAPFSAPVNEQEKRQYFARQLFTEKPDGTIDFGSPNKAGRDALMQTYGIQGLAQIHEGVMSQFKPGQKDVVATADELAGPKLPTDAIDEAPQE